MSKRPVAGRPEMRGGGWLLGGGEVATVEKRVGRLYMARGSCGTVLGFSITLAGIGISLSNRDQVVEFLARHATLRLS